MHPPSVVVEYVCHVPPKLQNMPAVVRTRWHVPTPPHRIITTTALGSPTHMQDARASAIMCMPQSHLRSSCAPSSGPVNGMSGHVAISSWLGVCAACAMHTSGMCMTGTRTWSTGAVSASPVRLTGNVFLIQDQSVGCQI